MNAGGREEENRDFLWDGGGGWRMQRTLQAIAAKAAMGHAVDLDLHGITPEARGQCDVVGHP